MEEAVAWVRRCPDPMPGESRRSRSARSSSSRTSARVHAGAADAGAAHGRRDQSLSASREHPRGEPMAEATTRQTIEAVWRIESAQLIGGLVRVVRDVGWPRTSPRKRWSPRSSAGRRWHPRQPRRLADDHREEPRHRPAAPGPDAGAQARSDREDQEQAFTRCSRPTSRRRSTRTSATTSCGWSSSPATRCSPPRRGWRSLRLLGGLTTEESARAFLVPEPTIAQRIVRAKRTLTEARVPFEVPRGRTSLHGFPRSWRPLPHLQRGLHRHPRRYLDPDRAVRGRPAPGSNLAALVPEEAEVHGLIALMELQASRIHARVGPGESQSAPGPGPIALGSAAGAPRSGGARPGGDSRPSPRPVHPPGGHRGLPRPSAQGAETD
jgi:hypothetical protein